jgi:hypothetical protein
LTSCPDYTVFVNSTDTFEDTWEAFFHLLAEYWPEVGHVVLNTETKEFSHPLLDITCTRVARSGEERVPWGECMVRALEHIPTETFVYLQDDYFLYDSIDMARMNEALRILAEEDLDCLRLFECGGAGPWEPTEYPWLWSVARSAAYRISLQAALWTKAGIRKYLRSHESPWQMEVWGSRRASRIEGRIWCVSRDMFGDGQRQVVPYVPTGIVKGHWNREAVELLFADHGLEVPFEVRGWWDPDNVKRSGLATKMRKLPLYAWDRARSL